MVVVVVVVVGLLRPLLSAGVADTLLSAVCRDCWSANLGSTTATTTQEEFLRGPRLGYAYCPQMCYVILSYVLRHYVTDKICEKLDSPKEETIIYTSV